MDTKLLTRKQVESKIGVSRSTIYRHMRDGVFPVPIKVGQRAVRWPASEIEEWLAKRPRATGDVPQEKGRPAGDAEG